VIAERLLAETERSPRMYILVFSVCDQQRLRRGLNPTSGAFCVDRSLLCSS
jgi:hypothetical protein